MGQPTARSNHCADCGAPITAQATYCMSCRFKGDRNPMYGTSRPEHVRQAISQAQRGVPEKHRGPEHQSWKEAVLPGGGRQRARRYHKKPTHCERCGEAKRLDWHHIDADTSNNARENLAALCRRCHQIVDGRHEFLTQVMPKMGRAARLR